MRAIHRITIPAGKRWPEDATPEGGINPFWFIRVDNRSASGGDVVLSLDGRAENDPALYWEKIQAGERLVRNVGKRVVAADGSPSTMENGTPPADELHFLNLSATVAVTLWVETDTEPIVDFRALISGSLTVSESVNIAQAGGQALPTPTAGAAPGMPILDISQYNLESAAALGASTTFTGAWRDTLYYNWFGALALSDQAGTLLIDEADAAAPTVTNLVASQATAATNANAPTPPAAGQQARIAPTKSLLRFQRVRYVNGATLQARFNLQSSLSPVN